MLLTSSGEKHGLVNSITNRVKNTDFKGYDPHIQEILRKEKEKDSKLVRAEYVNSTGKHDRLEMVYCKYAGDPIQSWKFIPGYTYDVPRGLAEEINESHKNQKKREGLLSVNGNEVNKDSSPLSNDISADWVHKFIPVGWSE